jgi:hypothetical protein
MSRYEQLQYEFYNLFANAWQEPSGFISRTTSTVTVTATGPTRTVAIAPVSGTFDYYIKGVRYTIAASVSVQWPAVEGTHFFYFDTDRTLKTTQDVSVWENGILGAYALVWAVNWDNTNSVIRRSLEERHGVQMPGAVHLWMHLYAGTQWKSGGELGNFVIGDGSLNTHAQFSVANCVISDEDIVATITDGAPQDLSPTANLPVFYLSGTGTFWRFKAANTYPFILSGEAGYTGASGRIAYNLNTGGTWSLSEVSQSDYVLVHIVATPDPTTPVIAVLGQALYTTLSTAQSGATTEANTIVGLLSLLSTEYRILSTVIYQTSTAYGNTPKARIVANASGTNYIDWTKTKLTGAAGVSAANHGSLSGLVAPADDHTQYALLAGRAGGQSLTGGTGSGESLTLSPTTHATKGLVESTAGFTATFIVTPAAEASGGTTGFLRCTDGDAVASTKSGYGPVETSWIYLDSSGNGGGPFFGSTSLYKTTLQAQTLVNVQVGAATAYGFSTSAFHLYAKRLQGVHTATFDSWYTGYTTVTGTFNLDLSSYQNMTITLTGTATLTFTNPVGACKGTIIVKQNGTGGHNITWPTGVYKLSGAVTIQTAANAITIVSYIYDGTNYYLSPGLGPMTT